MNFITPISLSLLDYYDTYSAFRFSPLDVNSRESACLTNFLLSGKCVLLELGHLPNECTVNVNEHGDETSLNSADNDISSPSTNNKLFSHMIISHNQELMIHSIAFGVNNPMSKIGPCYVVCDEKDHFSVAELEEFADEIDDEVLEKELRVEVSVIALARSYRRTVVNPVCLQSFINIIRTTTLYPLDTMTSGKIPIEDGRQWYDPALADVICLALRLLERHTRRCPVGSNETILFHMPAVRCVPR